jgi:hypothetical protein
MTCSICDRMVDADEMIAGKDYCVLCRDLAREWKKQRKETYSLALAGLVDRLSDELPEALQQIEREILIIAARRSTSARNLARMMGMRRTTALGRLRSMGINQFSVSNFSSTEALPEVSENWSALSMGVSWDNDAEMFIAAINIKDEKVYLGSFQVKKQAEEIYRLARIFKTDFEGNVQKFVTLLQSKIEKNKERK